MFNTAKLSISFSTAKIFAGQLAKTPRLWSKSVFCGQKRVSLRRFILKIPLVSR